MSEETKKIVLPAYLIRRFEAFRLVKGGEHSYLLRDKIQDKLYGWGEELESNALEVYVHHLRRKITPRIVRMAEEAGDV